MNKWLLYVEKEFKKCDLVSDGTLLEVKSADCFRWISHSDCAVFLKTAKDIEIKPKSRVIKVVIHTVDGDTITYMVEEKWKYMVDRLKKWMR